MASILSSVLLTIHMMLLISPLVGNQFCPLISPTSEGQQMALELSRELLPPACLSQQITVELRFIRFKYPYVSTISYRNKTSPGFLVTKNVSNRTLVKINKSEFGPLKVEKLRFGADIFMTLRFRKPYHPGKLSEILSSLYNIDAKEGYELFEDGDDITYYQNNSTYIFKRGWAGCRTGCIRNHYWVFKIIDSGGDAELIKEYGSSLAKYDPEL